MTSRDRIFSGALVLVVGATAALAQLGGCGDAGGDPIQTGASSAAGAGSPGTGGSGLGALTGSGGSGGSGSGAASGGGVPGPETCGGEPCADHTGSKDFQDPSAQPGDAALFEGVEPKPAGTDPAKEPAMLYPSHETMFPINVSRIRHEWRGPAGSVFKLVFKGPKTEVSIVTHELSLLPTDEQWDWIAESNRGAAVTLTVYGVDPAAPTSVWQSKPITLLFSEAEVQGAIYYWSTAAEGIMRAVVHDPIPVKFYTDPTGQDAGTCVACHTVSRDGKRLAVGYGGETLREVSIPERNRLVPTDVKQTRKSAWTTFSPDGKKLLVAADGKLTLIDADTGAPIGPDGGVVPLPAGKVATHPDWSALGDKVAIALGTKGGNKEVAGASIALLPYNGGAWGEPEVLVPASGGEDNNFFPSFSPDSAWIIYANAKESSKDAKTAKLFLVPSSGGAPISLTRLNERVNDADGLLDIGNTMPTWAPATKPGVFWVAFSSLRAYASLRPQDDKKDQIWIAAIDPKKEDPGYAAFWAPFQGIEEGNHRAFWAVAAGDTQCLCIEICGDSLDNDCDGVADETDCGTCAPKEICDNGKDDDCDCVVDECSQEICGDGIDNDGDGDADGADAECQAVPK